MRRPLHVHVSWLHFFSAAYSTAPKLAWLFVLTLAAVGYSQHT